MNLFRKFATALGQLWAPLLILLVVLACGLFVQGTSLPPELHPALSVALLFGPMI